MRTLSASELLDVWECGVPLGSVERALTLLAAACPEISSEALATLSIGARDADLLTLRERTFGSRMVGLAECPLCGERLELSFSVADLRADPPSQPDLVPSFTVDGYELQIRPPNSLDLGAIAEQTDIGLRRRQLVERCVIAAHREAEAVATGQLPASVVDAAEERIARADPQADARLEISCPGCNHRWRNIFDIPSFFWSEIEAWAARILHEIHILASAYGWREHEILALGPGRRQFYLGMIGG